MYKIEHKQLINTKYFHTMAEAIRFADMMGLKRYSVKPVH
jgi:hypothetical protein